MQAGDYARRFRRKGLDSAQRAIVRVLEKQSLRGRSVLEVGCGVGGLLCSLMMKGAGSGMGVEISGGMIAEAEKLAQEFGLTSRVSFLKGDFASLYAGIPGADIVVMDKVLCCYSEPRLLNEHSAARAAMFLAVSYPRDAWLARLFFVLSERLGTLLRRPFHPFYHDPHMLDESILQQGMVEVESETTPLWQIKVFRKGG